MRNFKFSRILIVDDPLFFGFLSIEADDKDGISEQLAAGIEGYTSMRLPRDVYHFEKRSKS